MSVLDVVRVAAGWLLVGIAPGLLLALALKPALRRDLVALVALAAPLSIGAVFVLAQLCEVSALRFGPWTLVVLLLPSLVVAWRRRGSVGPVATATDDYRAAVRVSALLALAGVVAGLAVWTLALDGVTTVPPNRDAKNHGFYVARIVETGSIDPAEVVVLDPVSQEPAAEFYPFGFHASAALAQESTGGPIPGLLTLWTALSAAVAVPLGLYALLRRLVPDRPLIAGYAALVTPFLAMFPNRPMLWGGLALIVGVALVPPTLALLVDVVEDTEPGRGPTDAQPSGPTPSRWPAAALGAVALMGTVSTHTSQAAFFVVIATPVLGWMLWQRRSPRERLGRSLVALVVTGAGAVLLYLPTVSLLAGGASERSEIKGANNLSFAEALGKILTLSVNTPAVPLLVLVLVLGGIGYAIRRTIAPAWMVSAALCLILFFASATPDGIWDELRPISAPWYWSYERTSYHLPMFAAFFAACALDGLAEGITRLVGRVRRFPSWPVALAVAGLWVVLATPGGLRSSYDMVRQAYVDLTNVGDPERAAFAYLADHDDCGSVVINQEQDGSAWMYAIDHVQPLVAISESGSPSRRSRAITYLLQHIHEYSADARVRSLVRRFDACYVYVGRPLNGESSTLQADQLARAEGFIEVGRFGESHLFKIVDR